MNTTTSNQPDSDLDSSTDLDSLNDGDWTLLVQSDLLTAGLL